MEMEIEMGEPTEGCGGGAESVRSLAAGSSISLRYHSLFGSHDDMLLLEVDEKILPDVLHHR